MRVLLAYDDSPCSSAALELTASLPWPDGTTIEVINVVEGTPEIFGAPDAALLTMPRRELEASALENAHRWVDAALERLRVTGCAVTPRVLRGRPAATLAREAELRGADLIVAGSRGHGPMDALLLGSVSTELADHAPCPVLVARGDRIARVVVATDGSSGSRHAIAQLVEWGILNGAHARVLSVARSVAALAGVEAAFEPRFGELEASTAEALVDQQRQIADEAATMLTQGGVISDAEVRQGDAANEIVRCARAYGADLVVTGSRGLGTLPRLLLGSVARKVLLHAGTSVLVMRPHPTRADQRVATTLARMATGLIG